jgi:hypothetical protein
MTSRPVIQHARPWTPRNHPDNPLSPMWLPLERRSEINQARWWATRHDEGPRPRLQDLGRVEMDIDRPLW